MEKTDTKQGKGGGRAAGQKKKTLLLEGHGTSKNWLGFCSVVLGWLTEPNTPTGIFFYCKKNYWPLIP